MSNQPIAPILHLEHVSVQATVGSDLLLQDISFKIQPGEIVGIIGASGAGKTSLLRLLNRLISHCNGEIYVQNISVEQLTSVRLRRKIILAAQEPKLLGMNVIDALSYPLKLQQLPESEIRAQIDIWTNLLRIPAEWSNKTELQLSLGQRQLVAIARVLMMQPEVILLDEPTSALDLGMANHLLTVLNDLNQSQNLTIMIVNHQLELIQGFCDRLLFLNQGILEEDVPASKLNWQRLRQKIFQLQAHQEQDWL
ncbi:MAG: ATP-binding cassette domain-containing protein [Waterburya sp.]